MTHTRTEKIKAILKIALQTDVSTKASPTDIFSGGKKIKIWERDTDKNGLIISDIQKRLGLLGYKMKYGADGIFGDYTQGALTAFQKENGLPVTGEISLEDYKLLSGGVAKRAPATISKMFETATNPKANSGESGGSGKEHRMAGGGAVSEGSLMTDLMAKLGNKNLCIAMVVNAKAESGLNPSIAGDCNLIKSKKGIKIHGKGQCCSFGLWQYNICGGLGEEYLNQYGSPSNEQAKLELLSDYSKQVEFMCNFISTKYPSIVKKSASVENFINWFVKEVERPRDVAAAQARRISMLSTTNL